VRPEGLGKLKNSVSSGLEPAIFQLVAQSLKHYATASSVYRIYRVLNVLVQIANKIGFYEDDQELM
jgi:hypothetical protein